MESISKSLQSTPSSDDLFGMVVAAVIKNLSPRKKRKIWFEINNLLFKYQEDNDAAAVPQPPPIQTPPPVETYGSTNTNLPSISLNEPWLYDSLRKYMKLNIRYFSTFKSYLVFANTFYITAFFGKIYYILIYSYVRLTWLSCQSTLPSPFKYLIKQQHTFTASSL